MRACTASAILAISAMFIATTPARADPRGLEDYVRGLQQITQGQYDDSAQAFERSLRAWDEDPDRHLARAIALMMAQRGKEAGPHLERVGRLQARHPGLSVWSYLYTWVWNRPSRSIPTPPHQSTEPYAKALISATEQYVIGRDENKRDVSDKAWRDIQQCAAAWAWRELARPELLDAQAAGLDRMYAQRDYAQCVTITSRLLASNPTDARLLRIRAGSRLVLGDHRGARTDYTLALRSQPTDASMILGRALAAARMGALPTAEADAALGRLIDPSQFGQLSPELDKAMDAIRARLPSNPTPDLLDSLLAAIASKASDDQIATLADRVIVSDVARRHVPDELYTDRLGHLQLAFDNAPTRIDKAVALAEFCIRPTADVPLADGKTRARMRVGQGDLERARIALDAAGKLDRDHHGALTQQALWMRAKGADQRMIQTIDYAFTKGALNYDLASMYLDFHQRQAAGMEQEAAALRMPSVHYETRHDGRWRVTTPPTPAALARAADLEAKAKEARRKSMIPMRNLVDRQPNTPFGKLAKAELHRMLGEYDAMIASAEEALTLDPWHLEAREHLIEHAPKVGLNSKALQHLDVLENIPGPSGRITAGPVQRLIEETRYASAMELLDKAQRIEPASGTLCILRGVALSGGNRRPEADAATAAGIALELARLKLATASSDNPLTASDAALALSACKARSQLHMRSDAPAAIAPLEQLLGVASRVPRDQWDGELAATRLPTVFTHDADKRRTGMTVRELVVGARMDGFRLLMTMDRLDEAARMLVACRQDCQPMANKPPLHAMAIPLIQKMGVQRASQVLTPDFIEGYQVAQRMGGSVREQFRGSETTGIDPQADRRRWIEGRLREIDNDLASLRRSQTMTAGLKRDELEAEKQQLLRELQGLPPSQQETPSRRRREPGEQGR